MSRFLPALLLAILSISSYAKEEYAPIQPFLDRYCIECHGAKKQKAEVRLDDFKAVDGPLWSDIYDQLLHGDMPPEDELQPSKEERERITKLVDRISHDDDFSVSTGYRRLNRREYANTVRDLLGLKPGLYDPAARIYHDEIDHGFDTNAEQLVISNELLLEAGGQKFVITEDFLSYDEGTPEGVLTWSAVSDRAIISAGPCRRTSLSCGPVNGRPEAQFESARHSAFELFPALIQGL